jgi:hypothetical protein
LPLTLLSIVRFILVIAMADIKNKQTKKTKKKHGNDFVSRIEELESQLSLKQDILERSDKKNSTLYDENREQIFGVEQHSLTQTNIEAKRQTFNTFVNEKNIIIKRFEYYLPQLRRVR